MRVFLLGIRAGFAEACDDLVEAQVRKVQVVYICRCSRIWLAKTKVLVKLKGVPASVLFKLVEMGYYGTKSEALRAGVVRLGKDFGMIPSAREAWMRLQSEIRKTGKRLDAVKVLRELERLETEA